MSKIPLYVREEEATRLRTAFRHMKLTKGLTQEDVATSCGWKSASTFGRLLTGKHTLTRDVLDRLCHLLDVDPSTVSPRLVRIEKVLRHVPVFSVNPASGGEWTDQEGTSYVLPHYSADDRVQALVFETASTQIALGQWVLVLEPSAKPVTGDWAVLSLKGGRRVCGQVLAMTDKGTIEVRRDDGKIAIAKVSEYAVVTHLARRAAMHEIRACAESIEKH